MVIKRVKVQYLLIPVRATGHDYVEVRFQIRTSLIIYPGAICAQSCGLTRPLTLLRGSLKRKKNKCPASFVEKVNLKQINLSFYYTMYRTISVHFYRQLSIVKLPVQIQNQTRHLFTKDFLGVSIFQQKQQIALKELSERNVDISTLRDDIHRIFGITKVAGVDGNEVTTNVAPANAFLSDDVRKLIYTSKTIKVK